MMVSELHKGSVQNWRQSLDAEVGSFRLLAFSSGDAKLIL